MLYVSVFDAKEGTSQVEINREREQWIREGKEKIFQDRCKSINRYEVLGISPLKIFFVIDTDDPAALNMISRHFGDKWNSVTYPATKREISEAYEEDRSIIGG
ncbi:MAG: hypothetical protein FD156_2737 [Nitrospirae bacterium]|nr:MAG: hypothetical protein FD156_2737 [Nitrospirota bacterium]